MNNYVSIHPSILSNIHAQIKIRNHTAASYIITL